MFSELKILELSNVLAGPAVGMFFAELGAQVIKVENKLREFKFSLLLFILSL